MFNILLGIVASLAAILLSLLIGTVGTVVIMAGCLIVAAIAVAARSRQSAITKLSFAVSGAAITGMLFFVVAQATAQTPAPPTPATEYAIDFTPILQLFNQILIALASAVITVVGGIVISKLNAWGQSHGLQIDAAHRDALETSAKNIAATLIQRGLVALEKDGKISVDKQILADAANTLILRVPDAVAHFGLTPAEIEARITAWLPQVMYLPPK